MDASVLKGGIWVGPIAKKGEARQGKAAQRDQRIEIGDEKKEGMRGEEEQLIGRQVLMMSVDSWSQQTRGNKLEKEKMAFEEWDDYN